MANGNSGPQRQFDPIAGAAIAGLNSTQRLGRFVRNQLQAPAPPGAEGAFNQSRTLLQQASMASPFNVLASGQGPQLPGMGGQGGGPLGALPNPQQLLGGMGAQGGGPLGGLPAPQQVLPTPQGGGGFPAPFGGMGGGRSGGGGGGNSGNNGGGSSQSDTGSRGREMNESR